MAKAYPKQSRHGIPHFSSFACINDSVSWVPSHGNPGKLTLIATVVCDDSTSPTDFDCYSQKKVKDWQDGDWSFIGLIVSVSRNGIMLDEHAASLWGIECNYNSKSNLYLAQVCKDLEQDALAMGHKAIQRLLGE